ncbi:MAG: tetratricopeptide repeat protein, partial [Planctomycetes bacterium]|nr:tetratricopeptide repeat protein [Planctomycetota bacterium]
MTAGVEVEWTPEAGRATRMGGLAVIFGHFPATFGDFVQLARARLHLAPGQARQLDPVLGARVMAMWAWLPDLRCDCYLEYDRATDAAQAWLIDPGGNAEELDTEATAERLDAHFLDALVLNGSGHWGGETGLARLVERFGRRPLLVAAQVADLLERCPREPRKVLEAARARWSALDAEQEEPWAALAGAEPPWALVQLGRLALRLGLLRAARALLSGNAAADQAPVAWFDLGQVCEALGDLPEAEQAFVHYAAARPHDPDAWRRLLFCRLRLDHLQVAEETLRRYRAAGGKDDDLAERYLAVVVRARLVAVERERLAAWAAARLGPALAHERPLG